MAGHGGTMNRRTANMKQTKLYWLSGKHSLTKTTIIVRVEAKKVERHDTKISRHFAPDLCSHIQSRSSVTG